MNKMFDRTINLIGSENYKKICNLKIAVIGLGGVGGTALEALARTGFSKFLIIDHDIVDVTNLNRQILFSYGDINRPKVEIAMKKILSINPFADIETHKIKVSSSNTDIIGKVDFIVDAVDDIKAKVCIAEYAIKNNIPFVSSLGMANRINPNEVNIIRLDKTTIDPLAKKFRYELKKNNIDTKKVMTVFSSELPRTSSSNLNSIVTVPSSAGLNICLYIINFFTSDIIK